MNRFPTVLTALALAGTLAGCSSMQEFLGGDRIDYRSEATKTRPLEVPPDLTQLAKDSRYQPQSGSVSASAMQAAVPAATVAATPTVAPAAVGELRVERAGDARWLVTTLTPEQLWPQLRAFWEEHGFGIAYESAEAGVMETGWAENRAKLPTDFVRNTLGKLLDSLYSTGERDKFRTRVERTPAGTEVYISHRGMQEVYVSRLEDRTMWTTRPSDPGLEAEFLTRLMVKLGTKEEEARRLVAAPVQQPPRARLIGGPGAALEVDESFDRAWRRVGLALDRSGFTVEDRDRTRGLYFVRYVDPKQAAKEEPGLLSRIFGRGKGPDPAPDRYRIALKAEGDQTTVSVLDAQGAPDDSAAGQRIVSLLVEDLK